MYRNDHSRKIFSSSGIRYVHFYFGIGLNLRVVSYDEVQAYTGEWTEISFYFQIILSNSVLRSWYSSLKTQNGRYVLENKES